MNQHFPCAILGGDLQVPFVCIFMVTLSRLVHQKQDGNLAQEPVAGGDEHKPLHAERRANNPQRGQQQLQNKESHTWLQFHIGYVLGVHLRKLGYPTT